LQLHSERDLSEDAGNLAICYRKRDNMKMGIKILDKERIYYVLQLTIFAPLLVGCSPDPNPKNAFNWVNSSDSLQMLGEGSLSRSFADLYNFAFTTDGDTIFFHTTDKGDGRSGIAISTRTDSGWAKPVPASFDVEGFNDGHVSISPTGNMLIFASDRTDNLKGDPKPADDFFMVTKSGGWNKVKRLTFTPGMSEKRGTLALDGTFYYWAYQRGSGMYFFNSKIDGMGEFTDIEDAGEMLFENHKGENNPFIDPDKKFMLFAAYGKEDGYGKEDIYFSKREGNMWSEPENLGGVVNTEGNDTSPYVTKDGKYLFLIFTVLCLLLFRIEGIYLLQLTCVDHV
jgi:hypothetical protein